MQEALNHIYTHHNNSDGWITLAQKNNEGYRQKHFKIDQLQNEISNWTGSDVYFSQNTFYQTYRRIEYLRQLRSLYVDIDCYKLGYTPDQVMLALEHEHFRQTIPEPNHVIYSGQGLVLIWRLEPLPHMALPRWQAVENYLIERLTMYGADSAASDVCRIFRIAGTINSKNRKLVRVQYRHDYIYDLEDIKNEYLPIHKPKKTEKKTRKQTNNIINMFNVHSLHYNRLMDITKLCELRNFEMTGYREMTLFLYRYWSCCFLSDKEEAEKQMLELNSNFTYPLPEREAIRATKNAERAYDSWIKNENNGVYKRGGYNYKNIKLIRMFDITPEEQKHMETIISSEEKQRRNTIFKREQRRNQGVKSRDDYLEQQKQITNEKLTAMRKLIAANPRIKNKELAELLSVSVSRVKQLKSSLADS